MSFSPRRPSFYVAFVLLLAAETALVKLAVWQYHRMGEKEALMAAAEKAMAQPTRVLTADFLRSGHPPAPFTPFRFRAPAPAVPWMFIGGVRSGPLSGYRVTAPVRLASDTAVVTDFGWVRADADLDALQRAAASDHTTSLNTPVSSTACSALRYTGVLRPLPPLRRFWWHKEAVSAGAGYRADVLTRVDTAVFKDAHVVPQVFFQLTEAPTCAGADAPKLAGSGAAAEVQAPATLPTIKPFADLPADADRHKEYMLTWASLAGLLPLLAGGLFWRRRD